MPTISSQPSTTVLHSVYANTMTYSVYQVFTGGDPYPAIEARIIINSALFSTQYYQPTSIVGTTAYFTIGINGIVQEWFESLNASPGTFDDALNSELTDSLASVRVDFYTWSAVGGLLEQVGSPANSSTSRAINSAQIRIPEFYAASERAFLTNKPDNTILKTNEGEVIAIYTSVNSEIVVKCYNANGLQAERRQTFPGSSHRIIIFGVGIPNLLALTSSPGWDSEPYVLGGDIFDGGASTYYTIQVKEVGGANISELRTYYIDTSEDCFAYRIHFLNKLGCYDSVSLYQSVLNVFDTQSTTFERNATELASNLANRLYSKLTNGFQAHFLGMTDEEATWLKELANTVDAYESDIQNHLIVEDMSGTEKDTYAIMNDIAINFIYSTPELSQRN